MSRRPEHYGSEQYLEEMDKILVHLNDLRKCMGRDERKERFTVSRAMDSIRHIRHKAKRHGIRLGLIAEDEK
jgi:hypothetical protein